MSTNCWPWYKFTRKDSKATCKLTLLLCYSVVFQFEFSNPRLGSPTNCSLVALARPIKFERFDYIHRISVWLLSHIHVRASRMVSHPALGRASVIFVLSFRLWSSDFEVQNGSSAFLIPSGYVRWLWVYREGLFGEYTMRIYQVNLRIEFTKRICQVGITKRIFARLTPDWWRGSLNHLARRY